MTAKIIIADDDAVFRDSLKALFSGTELHVVSEASTGEEVVVLVSQMPCDVVLLDVEMPNGDGLEALRQIKKAIPELPVLMHSALDNPRLIELSLDLGASGWLDKGADGQELINVLRRFVPRHCCPIDR